MKKILFTLFTCSILVLSCNNGQGGDESASQVIVTHKEMSSEVIRTVATMSIEGMTCAAGCGGKIQQDLRAMKGVVTTELDYADGRTSNVVSVEYNPGEVSETDLIKCVQAISDGQYHVKSVEVLHYKGLQSSRHGGNSDVGHDNFGKIFQVLNLLQSVARFIQG